MTSNIVRLDDRRREMALIQFFEQWDLDIEARKLKTHWANQFGYLDADGKFRRHGELGANGPPLGENDCGNE